MKKYLAIGHFKECKNMVSVAMKCNTKESFKQNLTGNEFVAYVVITESKFNKIKYLDSFDLYEEVKKMTTNYRKWNYIVEYIEQCLDIMMERLEKAE